MIGRGTGPTCWGQSTWKWSRKSFNRGQGYVPFTADAVGTERAAIKKTFYEESSDRCRHTPAHLVVVARTQKAVFITDCVMQLMGGAGRSQGGGGVDGEEHRHSSAADAFVGDKGENAFAAVECNPHLWQSNNAGLVDQKVISCFRYYHNTRAAASAKFCPPQTDVGLVFEIEACSIIQAITNTSAVSLQ